MRHFVAGWSTSTMSSKSKTSTTTSTALVQRFPPRRPRLRASVVVVQGASPGRRGDQDGAGEDCDESCLIDSFADELIVERSLGSLSSAAVEDVRQDLGEEGGAAVNESEVASTSSPSASSAEPIQSSSNEFVLILAACLIGISTGVGVVVFNDAVASVRHLIWGEQIVLDGRQLLDSLATDSFGWLRLCGPPVVASVLVGGISWATVAGGGDKREAAPFRTVRERLGRIVSAIIGLGTGVSLGPEGPSVEIGVDISQIFIGQLKSGRQHITSLIAAGSGAGVAAGFNAPISGVFFAVESVLQRDTGPNRSFALDKQDQESSGLTIAMILLASVLGAIVSQAGLGSSPAFLVPDYRLESLFELPLFIVFGGICGVVSSVFLFCLSQATDRMGDLAAGMESRGENTRWLLPVLGGATTGFCALFFPEVLYEGFENVNSVLSAPSGDYSATILLQIVALKIVATSVARGSGLRGGIYAPSIFIGASLGSAFGLTVNELFDAVSAPQAYALVGVGATLASACDIPLTGILLLFELTRDYLIIVPSLAAVGISYWISSNYLQYRRRRGKRPGQVGPREPVDTRDADANQGMSLDDARQLLSEAKDSEVNVFPGAQDVTIVIQLKK
jgi:H+/Cl- antiporter ClcA